MKTDYRKLIYTKLKISHRKPVRFKELLKYCRGKNFDFDKFINTIDKMKTHRDWYPKKYCPAYILPHWDKFVTKVKTNLANIEKFEKALFLLS